MRTDPHPLDLMIRKLEQQAPLAAIDRDALRGLPMTPRTLEPAGYLVREGDAPRHCAVLVSGYAFRQKLTREGTRQIVSLHLPGDLLDLQHLYLDVADHNVQMLTRAELAIIPRPELLELALAHPAIAQAFQVAMLIEASIFREWILTIGRRDARARIAHLLCEFGTRLDAQGLVNDNGYELPMTQEQLGDALGLTSVHVNRTLKGLENDGLITRNRRFIGFPQTGALRDIADFNARYLHMEQQRRWPLAAPGERVEVVTLV